MLNQIEFNKVFKTEAPHLSILHALNFQRPSSTIDLPLYNFSGEHDLNELKTYHNFAPFR